MSNIDFLMSLDPQRAKSSVPTSDPSEPYTDFLMSLDPQRAKPLADKAKNTGGLGEGLGYVLGSLGLGALRTLEGIFDFAGSGLMKLFGQNDKAKRFMENRWSHDLGSRLNNWYNPGKVMGFIGDVAGGIGNSAVGMAVGALTGGAGLAITVGTGAAGGSLEEAYAKTGKLGWREFGYAASVGVAEGGLEAAFGAGGKVLKSLGAKGMAKAGAKQVVRQGIVHGFIDGAKGEFFEEATQEILDPIFQKVWGIDKNAKVDWGSVLYSGAVGAVSGGIIGGAGGTANLIKNRVAGKNIVDNGRTDSVVEMGREFVKMADSMSDPSPIWQEIQAIVKDYDTLAKKEDKKHPIRQQIILGQMQRAVYVAAYEPAITRAKKDIKDNFVEFSNELNSMGIKLNDKAITLDMLQDENILTTLATAQVLGHLSITPDSFVKQVFNQGAINEESFTRFKLEATPEQVFAVNKALNTDLLASDFASFKDTLENAPEAVLKYVEETIEDQYQMEKALSDLNRSKTRKAPIFDKTVEVKEGITVYKLKNRDAYVSVARKGDIYKLLSADGITKGMTRAELDNLVLTAEEDALTHKREEAKKAKEAVDNVKKEEHNKDGGSKISKDSPLFQVKKPLTKETKQKLQQHIDGGKIDSQILSALDDDTANLYLDLLATNEDTTAEELEALAERVFDCDLVKRAELEVGKRGEMFEKNEPLTPEQKALLEQKAQEFLKQYGGSVNFDAQGNETYKGVVKYERKAFILTGLPASGKSTTVNDISMKYGTLVADSDNVKKTFKEFDNGWGANYVHEASSYVIGEIILPQAIAKGQNIALPTVGSNALKLAKQIRELTRQGYTVEVINIDVSHAEGVKRAFLRFIKEGRYVPFGYMRGLTTEYAADPLANANEVNGEFERGKEYFKEDDDDGGSNSGEGPGGNSSKSNTVGEQSGMDKEGELEKGSGDGGDSSGDSEWSDTDPRNPHLYPKPPIDLIFTVYDKTTKKLKKKKLRFTKAELDPIKDFSYYSNEVPFGSPPRVDKLGKNSEEVFGLSKEGKKGIVEVAKHKDIERTAYYKNMAQKSEFKSITDSYGKLQHFRKFKTDNMVRSVVKNYDQLSDFRKKELSLIAHEALEHGVKHDMARKLAQIAAHTGISFQFNKNAHSFAYTRFGKTVVTFDTNAGLSVGRLLIHEMVHTLRATEGYSAMKQTALNRTDEKRQKQIAEDCKVWLKERGIDMKGAELEAYIEDEITAIFYEEKMHEGAITEYFAVSGDNGFKAMLKKAKYYLRMFGKTAPNLAIINARLTFAYKNYLIGKTEEAKGFNGVMYDTDGIGSIKEQIVANLDKINELNPVDKITYSRMTGQQARIEANKRFKELGYEVDRQNFGIIEIGEKQIAASVTYLKTDAEYAALFAVPAVLKRGIEIGSHEDHKGRKYYNNRTKQMESVKTVTIAAPVEINGVLGHVGVVVKQTGANTYHTHRILMPDGSSFNVEQIKTEPTLADTNPDIGGTGPAISSASDSSVKDNSSDVKHYHVPTQSTPADTKIDVKNFESIPGHENISFEMPKEKHSFLDVVKEKIEPKEFKGEVINRTRTSLESIQVHLTNAQVGIENAFVTAKHMTRIEAQSITHWVRSSNQSAMAALSSAQFDAYGREVGRSWQDIWKDIHSKHIDGEKYRKNPKRYQERKNFDEKYIDFAQKFNNYLLQRHNKARLQQDKTIFSEDVTAEVSDQVIAEMEKVYPEFKKIAEEVNKFLDNLMQYRVDTGLVSQESADLMRKMYPYYVPTPREGKNVSLQKASGQNNVAINSTVKKATGSELKVLPIYDVVGAQVIQTIGAGRANVLANHLAQCAYEGNERIQILSREVVADTDEDGRHNFADRDIELATTENKTLKTMYHQVSYFNAGEKVTMLVDRNIYQGFQALVKSDTWFDNAITGGLAKANKLFKNLVTSWNPFFSMWRNPLKDLGNFLINTRYRFGKSSANYQRAMHEIKNNGYYWREAQAMGIVSSSIYNYATKRVKSKDSVFDKTIGRLAAVSEMIEMTPRLAEYISARESGKSAEQALYEAADVTTNFGRSGIMIRALNASVMPFLNPAVQGASKIYRALVHGEGGYGSTPGRARLNLLVRLAVFSIGATAFNAIMNDDDEDYANLSDYTKQANFVIPLGGGKFLKIPKDRLQAVVSSAYLRIKGKIEGDEFAWKDFMGFTIGQITPVDNLSRPLWEPIKDVKTNTTWFGGEIEGQRWDNVRPKNRYDERTSAISKWIGKSFNYSPIKIDYLLQQYTGILGDIVLPATSVAADRGIFERQMLANVTVSNRYSKKLSEISQEYAYKANENDLKAKLVLKYINKNKSVISEMYKQQQEIQKDKSLKRQEKLDQNDIIQVAINALRKKTYDNAREMYSADITVNEDNYNASYEELLRVYESAEVALKAKSNSFSNKAELFNKVGFTHDMSYDYLSGLNRAKEEQKGNMSDRDVAVLYTLSLGIPNLEKIMLLYAQGYKPQQGEVWLQGADRYDLELALAQGIAKAKLSKEDKLALAKICGLLTTDSKIQIKPRTSSGSSPLAKQQKALKALAG